MEDTDLDIKMTRKDSRELSAEDRIDRAIEYTKMQLTGHKSALLKANGIDAEEEEGELIASGGLLYRELVMFIEMMSVNIAVNNILHLFNVDAEDIEEAAPVIKKAIQRFAESIKEHIEISVDTIIEQAKYDNLPL